MKGEGFMKTVLIVIQSIMYNRGSEALCRGLTKIIKSMDDKTHIIINSAEKDFPGNLNIPDADEFVKRLSFKSKWSIKSLFATFAEKILKNKKLASVIRYKPLLKAAKKADIIMIIAADNFDVSPQFDFSGNSFFYNLLREQNNARIIMYDCSISEENITKSIVDGFNKCDVTTSRDSISINNLTKAGVNNLNYYPDPAFVMEKEECPLPEGWVSGKMVGVNLSNLAMRPKYGGNKEIILETYHKMIDSILDKGYNVVLVPHVMGNADLSALKVVYEKYSSSDRVIIIENENLTAPQLKYIISCCEVYIGARTHSTIAAYSSCVPTLVMGYSIKSRGIAVDLFGTDEDYVVNVSKIDNSEILVSAAMKIINNSESIRAHLKDIMPVYIEKAYRVSELLK